MQPPEDRPVPPRLAPATPLEARFQLVKSTATLDYFMSNPTQQMPSTSPSPDNVRETANAIRQEMSAHIVAIFDQAVRDVLAKQHPPPHVATEVANALGALTDKIGASVQTMVADSVLKVWSELRKAEQAPKASINADELLRIVTQYSSEAAQEAFRALGRAAEAVVQLSSTWPGDQDPSGRRGSGGQQN